MNYSSEYLNKQHNGSVFNYHSLNTPVPIFIEVIDLVYFHFLEEYLLKYDSLLVEQNKHK